MAEMLENKIIKGLSVICCILLGLSAWFVYPVYVESLTLPAGEAESAEENLSMLVEVINEPQNHTYYAFEIFYDFLFS